MRVLIIDPNISHTSPSLKALVRSIPDLNSEGIDFEAWCWNLDETLPIRQVKKFPRWFDLPILGGIWFTLQARLYYWWNFIVKKKTRPDLVFTVACYVPRCDMCLVQFSPFDWQKRQKSLGVKSLRDLVAWLQNQIDLGIAKHFFRTTKASVILCVSNAVRDDLREISPTLNLRLLPNSYDPERFNLTVRHEKRNPMRQHLGLMDEQNLVFIFASTGHYRRKGFQLAAEAVAILFRAHSHVRLLVIGGQENRLKSLKAELDKTTPNWEQFIIFTGMVSDMPAYLAAGDAFLFPSYSEAFALVEVEAAAMGLPLFLTHHHGSEMILKDGENGLYLEFDAEQIAKTLTPFVTGEWQPLNNSFPQGALDSNEYTQKFNEYLHESFKLKN